MFWVASCEVSIQFNCIKFKNTDFVNEWIHLRSQYTLTTVRQFSVIGCHQNFFPIFSILQQSNNLYAIFIFIGLFNTKILYIPIWSIINICFKHIFQKFQYFPKYFKILKIFQNFKNISKFKKNISKISNLKKKIKICLVAKGTYLFS